MGAFVDTVVKTLGEDVVDASEETAEEVGVETLERILISSFELTTTTVYTAAEDCDEALEETAAEVLETVIVEIFPESFESLSEFFEEPVGMAVELREYMVIPLVIVVVRV